MSASVFKHLSTERAVVATLALLPENNTLSDALKANSIDSLARSAIEQSLRRQVKAGMVGDDIKKAVGYDEYFSAAWRLYQKNGVPESIANEAEINAASIPAGE